MSAELDTILAANAVWADDQDAADLDKVPARSLAVVTCMDARLDPLRSLGLDLGQAHVIRNAGALVTEDVERSLLLSQYALGTRTILVIGHTDCGVQGHDEEATGDLVEQERGTRPQMELGSFSDPAEGVREGVERLRSSAVLRDRDAVHGFVHDVTTGLLEHVE